jgi:radical SAM protein with 4Fe4S-binding SPASM domain
VESTRLRQRNKNIEVMLESANLQEPFVKGYPCKLMIEPTNMCDLRCPLCPTGAGTLTRSKGMLSARAFRKAIDELDPYLSEVILFNYGEPFLNPEIYEMIAYARKQEIRTCSSTNGFPLYHDFPRGVERLMECGLDHLIVPISGATEQSHARYRVGSDLRLILKGLELLRVLKTKNGLSRPLVDIHFIVMRHNEKELDEVMAMARRIGADQLSLKTANLMMVHDPGTPQEARRIVADSHSRAPEYLPESLDLSRHTASGSLRDVPARGCTWLWDTIVVNQNGDVSPCCYDLSARFDLGNAFETDIKEIWTSEKYGQLRRKVAKSRQSIPLCSICPNGAPVMAKQISFGGSDENRPKRSATGRAYSWLARLRRLWLDS